MEPETSLAPKPEGATPFSLVRIAACYLELAKARLGALVVLTAAVGYLLAARGRLSLGDLAWTCIGTALSSFGANILNQSIEAERDGRMRRTRSRPLPAGRISRLEGTVAGIASAAAGVLLLASTTNLLTAGLALATILLYVLAYTPLKVRTPLNTIIGAVCGAVPPMMGWAAGAGRLDAGAWILGGVLFAWQIPHFLALAWLFRDDYRRGGFRMLPAVDPGGRLTGGFAVLYAAALLPVTAALTTSGVTGGVFLATSQVLGLAFAGVGWQFLRSRSDRSARRLFLASVLYLPLVLGLMVTDVNVSTARVAQQPPAAASAERS